MLYDMILDTLCLLYDLALKEVLCVVELMKVAKYIDSTSHNCNLAKECDKRLSQGKGTKT